ncbi:MAG: single-stranded-DNA-specific exonuclease RecJ [Chloroflexi bacterium]|nr:single-stranded-DNA-specific exonuclease RecJ [Chloroflexota bacterium]
MADGQPLLRRAWTRRRRASLPDLQALEVGSPLLAQLLLHRGLSVPADASQFLEPARPLAPALDGMAGLRAAVQRIERALDAHDPIVVYGDYDVDGLSGATILQRTLEALGGRVKVYIPHRERDGYGLNADVLRRLAEGGAALVVTVDCGVTAAAEVAAANAVGLDVVVTDHHALSAELPSAVAVVNPHRPDCPYPFKELAGAGVALMVALTLAERRLDPATRAALEPTLLGLAALGTVSDVMPLVGENRGIVRHGLRALNAKPPAGLAALFRRAGLTRPWIEAEDISFKIAPRLNAAGRLADAALTQQLLATTDPVDADDLADQLEAMNAERRELSAAALDDARARLLASGEAAAPGIVVQSGYPSGLLGLVAVRLCEELGKPVAVVEAASGLCRASVRAPKGLSAVAAVAAGAHLLARYGGHQGAAGFSIEAANLAAFRQTFAEAVAAMPADPNAVEALVADAWLRPASVDEDLLDGLGRLGPFGHGAPEPLFESLSLEVAEAKVAKERHLRLRLRDENNRMLSGIAFDGAADGPSRGQLVDVLYRVRPNVWQGRRRADIHLVAWRPAGT